MTRQEMTKRQWIEETLDVFIEETRQLLPDFDSRTDMPGLCIAAVQKAIIGLVEQYKEEMVNSALTHMEERLNETVDEPSQPTKPAPTKHLGYAEVV